MSKCPTCGTSLRVYRHKMNAGLMRGFKELMRVGGVAKLSELKLSSIDFTNFQKLKYFGIVQKEFLNGAATSRWCVTEKGQEFFHGVASIPSWVETFQNQVVKESEQTIFIFEKLATKYQKREDYLEEHDTP